MEQVFLAHKLRKSVKFQAKFDLFSNFLTVLAQDTFQFANNATLLAEKVMSK